MLHPHEAVHYAGEPGGGANAAPAAGAGDQAGDRGRPGVGKVPNALRHHPWHHAGAQIKTSYTW